MIGLKWYHGVIFYVVVTILSGSWLSTSEYLDSQGRPPFMPPDYVFPPVWIVNNILMIWAGLRIANKPEDFSAKKQLLWLQAVVWLGFVSFSWCYFALHSPILAAGVALIMWGANFATVLLAYPKDKAISFSLFPLLIWLSLASAIAIYQAIYTTDELFN
ncbi:TspO and MBR like protein [Chloroherpeton thalassium ATCC 35110]|uniref:TspO and MBR like protein n=1 Tax=Chloroherpeton thalassium (strain ATCC 35110 / GB-78) TaxID=517418 RepID=B3QTP7_CHLT3|nr:TspO/MBR family protein [Chloroherpeton thalassium]ACF14245.1 TspO and MBR like protein [Chloroherpeton thalassium ATCC 35110]